MATARVEEEAEAVDKACESRGEAEEERLEGTPEGGRSELPVRHPRLRIPASLFRRSLHAPRVRRVVPRDRNFAYRLHQPASLKPHTMAKTLIQSLSSCTLQSQCYISRTGTRAVSNAYIHRPRNEQRHAPSNHNRASQGGNRTEPFEPSREAVI